MKLLHTMIRVADIKKSLAFYQDILGLKLSRTKELTKVGATLYFLTDEASGSEIELTYNHVLPEGGYTRGSYFGHLAFETEDMNKFTEKLKKFGIEYARPPFMVTENGPKIAFVDDPNGISIEIIEKRK